MPVPLHQSSFPFQGAEGKKAILNTKITLSHLESHLWGTVTILRGWVGAG